MRTKSNRQSFLVEVPAASPHAHKLSASAIRLGRRSFSVTSLIDDRSSKVPSWVQITPKTNFEGQNPWDWAHDLSKQLGTLLAESVYVEPDLEQSWPYLNKEEQPTSKNARESNCSTNGPDPAWPTRPEFAWHLGDDYSQLKKARDAIAKNGMQSRVRICHLDTGYDPSHITTPVNINHTLEYNFVENIADARDPGARGILYNPGHGTGTLGLLAGNYIEVVDAEKGVIFADYLGGAPHAEIVPVRVANSVVHLWTSSMVKGIEYAIAPGPKRDQPPCHVVSISMGGLPSRAWAAAFNRAYDAGVVVVAAAGNNFGGFPMRSLVWPARFRRVIAACGVTSDQTPYMKSGLNFKMQGNYGPQNAMTHAIAGYTPNCPWAELGCHDIIDLDGAGTSSATPQIAAASALWLEKHLDTAGGGWHRVENVRAALFASGDKSLPESARYYGNGALKSFDALSIEPKDLIEFSSEPKPEDDITFPFLRKLKGWDTVDPSTAKMFEVESAQLYAAEPKLQDKYPDLECGVVSAPVREIVETFLDHPNISHRLQSFLISSLR